RGRLGAGMETRGRVAVDGWGWLDRNLRPVLAPLEELVAREFPAFEPFPYGQRWLIHRLVRHILLAEAMVGDLADRFRDLRPEDVEELVGSFRFERTVRPSRLDELLRRFA